MKIGIYIVLAVSLHSVACKKIELIYILLEINLKNIFYQ